MAYPLIALFALLAQDAERLGSVSGTLVNSVTGALVPKANVEMYLFSGGSPKGQAPTMFTTDSNAQGEFAFTGIPPGTYKLLARRQGFIRPGASLRPQSHSVGPAESVTAFKVTVVPQAIIAGRITDLDGDPLQGVLTVALKRGIKDGHPQFLPVSSVTTNDLGEFRIVDLPAGRYYVMANPHREVIIRPSTAQDTTEP